MENSEVEVPSFYRNERDPRVNASTAPSADERIRIPTIWVFEAFTPTVAGALRRGAERLNWLESDRAINPAFPDRIDELRSYAWGGGWLNLGYVVPVGTPTGLPPRRVAPLPSGVTGMQASLLQPIPSTTILCCQFLLNDDLARSAEVALRETFATYMEPLRGGARRIVTVEQQKAQRVELERESLCAICAKWVVEYFPGHFHSEIGGNAPPTCELMLFTRQEDFAVRGRATEPNFLQVLSLEHTPRNWASDELPGLYLQFRERLAQSATRAVLFGNVNLALSGIDLRGYGETKEEQIVHWCNYLDSSFGAWVLRLIAQDFIAEIGKSRDSYGSVDLSAKIERTQHVRELDQRFLHVQRNAVPFAHDVAIYCESEARFMHEVYEFRPTIDLGFEQRLFGDMRLWLKQAAAHIQQAEQQVRAIAAQCGQMISAAVNEDLARTNVRLQRRISFMTAAVLLLTSVMAWDMLKAAGQWLYRVLQTVVQ